MDTQSNILQPINIKKVFYEKNPAIAKWLPGFVFNYLKKIVHEQEVNDFLALHGEKLNMDFIDAALESFNVRLSVEGMENLPKKKRLLFVANHPLGGFDGLMLLKTVSEKYGNTKVLINDILMNISNIKSLFIPINKHGRQATDFANTINNAYASNDQLISFPAGLVSRKINKQIMDFEWQKSFILKSKEYKRTIIPTYITGENSKFFYRLSKIRTFLGIKANIEMLYLADETFKHSNKSFTIKFGKPISFESFDKSRKPREWSRWVKEQTYALNGINNVPC